MGSVESGIVWAALALVINQVEASQADAGSSVEEGVIATRRSSWFALVDIFVEDPSGSAGLGRQVLDALLSVPGGALRAGSAGVEGLLEESRVAGAADSVEVCVSGTGGNGGVGGHAVSVAEFIAVVADAGD